MNDNKAEKESYTLFVGEGDFSFSANYIVKSKNCYEKIYASCLNNQPVTEQQLRNINILKENGGFVFTNVDATRLESHHVIKDLQFSKIIFNFPHIPGKNNIRKNRQLLEQFFLSSCNVLKQCGVIMVTLCQGQGGTDIEKVKRKWSDTWQIVNLAAAASLILYRVKPFNACEFDMYQCTGFRGQQKSFKTKGALTHMFKLSNPVCLKDDATKSYLDATLYLQNVEEFLRNIHCNLQHPFNKISDILKDVAQKSFPSIHQETICDLFTCMRLPPINFDTDFIDTSFCKNCMSDLISSILLKVTPCVTLVQSYICCVRNICINSFPFYYSHAYVSDNMFNLLTSLPLFLKHLKQIYSLNDSCSLSIGNFECLQDSNIVHFVSQNSGTKNMYVKHILTLYAVYSVSQGEEFFFYSDVNFVLAKKDINMETETGVLKCGSVLQIVDNIKSYFCILFDISVLSCLKYHSMDYRTLLSDSSFYSPQVLCGFSVDLYRPLSIYPSTFVHDVSFYINESFTENELFLVIRNAIGSLIKSVSLLDSFYNNVLKKHSRCYRFIYQSCDKALSKSKVDYIHTKFMRTVLENSLNVSLR